MPKSLKWEQSVQLLTVMIIVVMMYIHFIANNVTVFVMCHWDMEVIGHLFLEL